MFIQEIVYQNVYTVDSISKCLYQDVYTGDSITMFIQEASCTT